MKEVFKPVIYEGYEHYHVSNLGRIYNERTGNYLNFKPRIDTGYVQISLTDRGRVKKVYLQRIVWESFNGLVPNGLEINHINHIKEDCRLSNLELVTHKDNLSKMSDHYGYTRQWVGKPYDEYLIWAKERKSKGKLVSSKPIYYCDQCRIILLTDPKYNLCRSCFNKSKDKGMIDIYQGVHDDGTVKMGKSLRSQISKDELVQLLKEYTFFELGTQYNVSDNAIRNLAKNYGMSTSDKDYWTDAKQERRTQRKRKAISGVYGYNKRKVAQYTLDGELVAVYDSIAEAKNKLGIGNISNCLGGRRKSAGGFIWKYYDE